MKYQHLTNLTPNHQTFICLCLLLLPLLMASYNDAYAETEEVTKKVHPSPSHQMAPLYLGLGWSLRWPDGRVPIVYNPANAPPPFADQNKAVAIIKKGLAEWENICGIHFDFLGVTNDALENYEDNRAVIGWEILEDADGVAYSHSDYTENTIKRLGYRPYTDGRIKIEPIGWGEATFIEVLVHELGHLIGLGHSDNPVSFLYANPYGMAYQPMPDDIEACQALYGPPNHFRSPQVFSPPPFSATASITNDFFYISSSWDNTSNHVSSITDATVASDDDYLYLQFDYNNFPLGEINFIAVKPLGYDVYNEDKITLKYSSSGGGWPMWVGSVKRMKKFPGTWRVYAVSGNQTLFTRSIEVNTTPIPWNRPPEATLFITQAPTDNPLAILATVYAHDPEGNNTSVVWHIPEEGESKADFKDQISKTITFPAPGIYTLYVEINDDAPRYEEGSGFRVLKSETITVPLPPTTSPAIPNLVNGWGKCLDVHLPDLYTNGGKVQIWECMGTLNQQWFFNEHQQLVNGGGKCLDVHFPDLKTNGGKVQLWDCAPDLINQQWRLKGKTLVNGAGKCLDVHVPDRYTNGGKVQIWDCNDGLNQQWNNMITLVNEGGKCLDVHAPDLQMNGGKVQIWDCYGGLTQQWQFYHHQLVNAGGKCLDVYAPDLQKNGARIQIWECNGGPQQQWQFYQNRLVNGGGKCLDIHAPDLKKNGGRVQVWDCYDVPNQKWLPKRRE